jgi:hypothetical protein
MRRLRPHLEAAVRPIAFTLCDEARRRVIAAAEALPPCFNDEAAALDARVLLSPLRVVLRLLVTPPAAAAHVVTPLRRIGQARLVEFIRPDEVPLARAGFCWRSRLSVARGQDAGDDQEQQAEPEGGVFHNGRALLNEK